MPAPFSALLGLTLKFTVPDAMAKAVLALIAK
jgi:hypothetical protein